MFSGYSIPHGALVARERDEEGDAIHISVNNKVQILAAAQLALARFPLSACQAGQGGGRMWELQEICGVVVSWRSSSVVQVWPSTQEVVGRLLQLLS
jgi:hypothetical protein